MTTALHARELVELAAVMATHSGAVVRGTGRLSQAGLHQYWSASRARLHRWGCFLKQLSDANVTAGESARHHGGLEVRAWFEEIFVSEALTRVWAATALGHDLVRGDNVAESVVRGVALGHTESRLRAMRLLGERRLFAAGEASSLDRLRRRAARWIDLLVAHVYHEAGLADLLPATDLCELAIEPPRARDFADDLRHQSGTQSGREAWSLTLASLRSALCQGLCPSSPSAELNHALATGVVSCLSSEMFDSIGAFRSLWVMRLVHHTSDVQVLVDDLLSDQQPPTPRHAPLR